MRVLQVHDLTFREFPALPDRPYAILSHVWNEREISYQDLTQSTLFHLRQEPSFAKAAVKIEGCRIRAQSDCIEYIWIDTCCIDKSNYSELTEAINSMFYWYKMSTVCYAYLDDVLWMDPWSMESGFARSKWFTRGWTLQELLAPNKVEFLSYKWKRLGNRFELARLISRITYMRPEYLNGARDIDEASIAQRMSWASERQTSKVEDMAYCLLGIFNVNMPLLYGEGLTAAFRRLQVKILGVQDDTSIFAWNNMPKELYRDPRSSKAVFFGLLAPSPACFRDSYEIIQQSLPAVENYVQGIRAPFIFNNKGLHLSLPVLSEATDSQGKKQLRAVLGCSRIANPDELVTVLLQDVSTNGGRCVRIGGLKMQRLSRIKRRSIWTPLSTEMAVFEKEPIMKVSQIHERGCSERFSS